MASLVPRPAPKAEAKRAWYQPTRGACANFSQIFGKPYTTVHLRVTLTSVAVTSGYQFRIAMANVRQLIMRFRGSVPQLSFSKAGTTVETFSCGCPLDLVRVSAFRRHQILIFFSTTLTVDGICLSQRNYFSAKRYLPSFSLVTIAILISKANWEDFPEILQIAADNDKARMTYNRYSPPNLCVIISVSVNIPA